MKRRERRQCLARYMLLVVVVVSSETALKGTKIEREYIKRKTHEETGRVVSVQTLQ